MRTKNEQSRHFPESYITDQQSQSWSPASASNTIKQQLVSMDPAHSCMHSHVGLVSEDQPIFIDNTVDQTTIKMH